MSGAYTPSELARKRVPELKTILQSQGASTHGKKSELVQRILTPDLSHLTVKDLQAELRSRGMSPVGTKAVLITRLSTPSPCVPCAQASMQGLSNHVVASPKRTVKRSVKSPVKRSVKSPVKPKVKSPVKRSPRAPRSPKKMTLEETYAQLLEFGHQNLQKYRAGKLRKNENQAGYQPSLIYQKEFMDQLLALSKYFYIIDTGIPNDNPLYVSGYMLKSDAEKFKDVIRYSYKFLSEKNYLEDAELDANINPETFYDIFFNEFPLEARRIFSEDRLLQLESFLEDNPHENLPQILTSAEETDMRNALVKHLLGDRDKRARLHAANAFEVRDTQFLKYTPKGMLFDRLPAFAQSIRSNLIRFTIEDTMNPDRDALYIELERELSTLRA